MYKSRGAKSNKTQDNNGSNPLEPRKPVIEWGCFSVLGNLHNVYIWRQRYAVPGEQ